MAKLYSPALLTVPQFAEFAGAVVTALPRDIDPDVAQGWMDNKPALRNALRRELTPPGGATLPPPKDWWEKLFGLAVIAGRFTDVDSNITGMNFPYAPGDLEDDGENIELTIDHRMSTGEVRSHLARQLLTPARPLRLLRWWLDHPEKHNSCITVALGQDWHGFMVFVNGHNDFRKLNLRHVGCAWPRRFTLLAVRKSA